MYHFFNPFIKDNDKRYKCTNCNEKISHQFIKKEKVIKVVNRSGPIKPGLKHNYVCVLRANAYFIHKYSVYKCLKCGSCKNVVDVGKRISKEEADASNLKKLNELQFRYFVRR